MSVLLSVAAHIFITLKITIYIRERWSVKGYKIVNLFMVWSQPFFLNIVDFNEECMYRSFK